MHVWAGQRPDNSSAEEAQLREERVVVRPKLTIGSDSRRRNRTEETCLFAAFLRIDA